MSWQHRLNWTGVEDAFTFMRDGTVQWVTNPNGELQVLAAIQWRFANGTAALPAITFDSDTNTGLYRIGADRLGFTTAGVVRLEIGASGQLLSTPGALSGTPGTTGGYFNQATATYTDNNTAASGTASIFTSFSIQAPTLAATNTSVTTTNGVTFYVSAAPTAGTNQTITQGYCALFDAGIVRIDGNTELNSIRYTWPSSAGSSGNQLQTDAASPSVLSWAAAGSLREYKNIFGLGAPADALDKLLGTAVYRFYYKPTLNYDVDGHPVRGFMGTNDGETEYMGVTADEAPWAMHHGGRILNPINAFGYTVLGFQAMNGPEWIKAKVREALEDAGFKSWLKAEIAG